MSLGKQDFIKYLNEFQNGCDEDEKNFPNGIFEIDWMCNITGRHYPLIIGLMEKLFNINSDWLGWFCFENDFGRKGLECSEKNGPEVSIKTAADLWDFLKGKEDESDESR